MSNLTDSQVKIVKVCDELKKFLLEKNRKYGNSALEPMNIFFQPSVLSKKNPDKDAILLLARIDDKLSRINNRSDLIKKNDTVDLIGYLILLCVRNGWTDFQDQQD